MPLDGNAVEIAVLKRYPKAVAHLWCQNNRNALTMLFGAGASIDLGFPNWPKLVDRIRQHPDVKGKNIFGAGPSDPLPTATQVLFQNFRTTHLDAIRLNAKTDLDAERLVQFEWLKILHQCLYADVGDRQSKINSRDCVYAYFLPIIKKAPVTVTYNFDDSIEQLLLDEPRMSTEEGRGFEAVLNLRLPFRLTKGNILHVNGFIPSNLLEGHYGDVTLNEVDFADQLIASTAGTHSTLIHYLSKQTFLLVGVSLQDEILRHLLRQNAQFNPGHYHYRIERVSGKMPSIASTEALTLSHFSAYNLVTLYLNDAEIEALGRILSATDKELVHVAEQNKINLFFINYLVGQPGAGKTTAFRHFASLSTQDEWLDERLTEMSRPWMSLTSVEKQKVDKWIADQVMRKNRQLSEAKKDGIGVYIIDRCSPDAISFTEPDLWHEKACSIREAVSDQGAKRTVEPGQVIFLEGDPCELLVRANSRGRQLDATEEQVEWQQEALKMVYFGDGPPGAPGVYIVNCRDATISEVVRKIARLIFLEKYDPCNIDKRLKGFIDKRLPIPAPPPVRP